MQRGWSAKGFLQPLWGKVGGRDRLADISGVSRENLSSMNSGKRRMGYEVGERIAAALGVTIYELGAPRDTDGREATLFDRLRAIEVAVDRTGQLVTQDLLLLATRIEGLEAAVQALTPLSVPPASPTTRTRTAR